MMTSLTSARSEINRERERETLCLGKYFQLSRQYWTDDRITYGGKFKPEEWGNRDTGKEKHKYTFQLIRNQSQ